MFRTIAQPDENDWPESEQAEQAKLEWLRAAAREGFNAVEPGDYAAFVCDDEISAFMMQIRDEVKTELADDRPIG